MVDRPEEKAGIPWPFRMFHQLHAHQQRTCFEGHFLLNRSLGHQMVFVSFGFRPDPLRCPPDHATGTEARGLGW